MSAKKEKDDVSKPCTGICKIKRSDKTITCFVCETMFHYKCSGISIEECNVVKYNDNSGCVYLCRSCKISVKNNINPSAAASDKSEIKGLKEQISLLNSNMDQRLSKIENSMGLNQVNKLNDGLKNIEIRISEKVDTLGKQITNKVDSNGEHVQNKIMSYAEKVSGSASSSNQLEVITEINKKVEGLKNDLNYKFTSDKESALEMKLVESRKNNICIFYVPESLNPNKEEAYQEDIIKLKSIFFDKIELKQEDIKEVYRKEIKNKTNPRPIIMKLS